MDLRCRKTICMYNKNLTCTAQNINITEKFICSTFKEDSKKQIQDFSKQIFTSTPPKIDNYKHIKNTCLICKAKCLFNNNHQCKANGITINAPISTPKCITFMKP